MKSKAPQTAAVDPQPTVPRLAFSVDEAAESVGLSRTVLYEDMKDGKLQYVKRGARRLIPASALELYLAQLGGAA